MASRGNHMASRGSLLGSRGNIVVRTFVSRREMTRSSYRR